MEREESANGESCAHVCLHEAFQWQARKTPEAIAITAEGEAITYGELEERSNALGWRLKEMGVGPEVPVALYLERSPAAVLAILAVLKAGGYYVPVDRAYPVERFKFMLENAQARVLVTQTKLAGSVPGTGAQVVCIDSVGPGKFASKSCPPNETSGHNAAYVIYTSGSTGTPKGVVVTHENVLRLLRQTQAWYGFDSNDVWPWFHSYAFDVSVWELWGALLHGGRLVIVPYLVSRSPADFLRLLQRERVTVLNQTPSAFRQLIWAESQASAQGGLHLRYVICAGEALELQSLKPWFDRHGDEHPLVVNMYGITETTVHATYRPIRAADLARGRGSVIGVPIPDLQIHLLDEQLRPVPRGETGEICVGGHGVARGYLNRPELTEQRFVPDPFSAMPGARLYRSGDLGRYSTDGELEYLGRMDHQVKIRGFRVELGEIESMLNRHPDVRESVVLARDAGLGDRRLVAYVVPVAGAPRIDQLREHLGRNLPEYMVPAQFVRLASLPLTTNGKLDRGALPLPDGVRPALRTEFAAPRNDTERTLAGIWSAVLGIEPVGVHDNFFELGGDSILSLALLSRAAQQGLRLTVEQMFAHPTVAGMAVCARPCTTGGAKRRSRPFSLIREQERRALPDEIEDAYPVSQLQLGMFFHNELSPGSAIYHDVFSFFVRAEFEPGRFEGALQRLAGRHAVLRTSFDLVSFSEPTQLVHRSVSLPFGVEDLRGLSRDAQETTLRTWIEREKRKPFDRACAPLFRFHVQRLTDDTFQFIISFHHSCLDGWSLAVLTTELLQDYVTAADSAEGSIASPRLSYRDFIRLEKEALASAESRAFWAEKLAHPSVCRLPRWNDSSSLRRERIGSASETGRAEAWLEQARGPEVSVPESTLTGLQRLAHAAGVPLKTVLLAAHLRVMSLLYGHSDVISGLICNGRPEEVDGEKLLGLFLGTVPLRQRLTGGTWEELVKQTFAAEQELAPHRRFPLAEIRKLNDGRPLFEAAFDFVHFHVYRSLTAGTGIDFREGHYFEANDLTLYTTFALDASSKHLELHLDYDPNALRQCQVEQITAYYLNTLEAMVANRKARYDAFSPLSPAERQRLVSEWNQTAAEYPRNRCLHELFEARVREGPDEVALIDGERPVTYRELDGQANRVAQRLSQEKREPGFLAGVCVERSGGMVAALLGVLKAGGAYVPLDPDLPRERLTFMIEEANVRVLVTQRDLAATLPQTGAEVVFIDPLVAAPLDHWVRPTWAPIPAASGLAYAIYTSGSTGQPKAVQVAHRSVVNVLTALSKSLGIGPGDNFLAVTTLSFDIATLELFLPLITGGRVTLGDRQTAADGTALAACLGAARASVMQATPTTWRLLIEAGWTGQEGLKVLCGGEALSQDLAEALLARADQVWNLYGPTETTIWSTVWQVQPAERVVIGRPIANTQCFILDRARQLVPVGVIGELHIAGDGVAQGYLNRPELTAEKFVRNPFNSQPGSRLYKTGDLARYRPDGSIETLGRSDHQVKIRGYRIELGEVESILRQHPGIADTLVVSREDGHGGQRLVAYVASRNGPLPLAELRDFVRAKLPGYMVPAQFVQVQELPRTPNGKRDGRGLPDPEANAVIPEQSTPPQDDLEKALAEIWQGALGRHRLGRNDDFFELGGDSLAATRVFARLERRFGTGVTLGDVFEHPTIAHMVKFLRSGPGLRSPRSIARRAHRRITLSS